MFRFFIHCKAWWDCMMRQIMIWKRLLERYELCFIFLQAVHTSIVSQSQFSKPLIMPRMLPKKNPCLLRSGVQRCSLLPDCCANWSASHSHGSSSRDKVFLTGYKWRQTYQGCKCECPYPIPRCILNILEELSKCTFHQSTRWIRLTNSNLLSPIVQQLTYSILCNK